MSGGRIQSASSPFPIPVYNLTATLDLSNCVAGFSPVGKEWQFGIWLSSDGGQSGLKSAPVKPLPASLVAAVTDAYGGGKSQNEPPTSDWAQLSGQLSHLFPSTSRLPRSNIAFLSLGLHFKLHIHIGSMPLTSNLLLPLNAPRTVSPVPPNLVFHSSL